VAAGQEVLGERSRLEIRPLTQSAELAEAVRLQREIWGFDDVDLLPYRLFVVATKIGGQLLGAFDGARLVGFCLSIPGLKPGGKYYLHSHMTGVLEAYQGQGVGRRLKLAQREDALSRGIELIEWTFDPLEIRNAHFNIARLGAVVRRFVENQYGISSSPLHGGLPTDRCVAEWWIASARVAAVIEGRPLPGSAVEARIEVPRDIIDIKRRDPRQAREIQGRLRADFQHWLRQGLAVTGYEITPEAGVFLLGPVEGV
jgi:predicted GNAT superfamily acetyltransferase